MDDYFVSAGGRWRGGNLGEEWRIGADVVRGVAWCVISMLTSVRKELARRSWGFCVRQAMRVHRWERHLWGTWDESDGTGKG